MEVRQRETPKFILPDSGPPNSPDLNPVDYRMERETCALDASSTHGRPEAALE